MAGIKITGIKSAIAAAIACGLLLAPAAVEAKKQRSSRHSSAGVAVRNANGAATAAQPRAPYGSSGPSIGTVTAPSVGSYNWPSVGVTNAVPTWSNTTR